MKERHAESWCGKSYYERLAEMTSNEAGAEDNEEEDGETIDNLQTKLLEALGSGKPGAGKAKKQKGERKPSAKGRGRRKKQRGAEWVECAELLLRSSAGCLLYHLALP